MYDRNSEESSLSLSRLPGGRIVQMYMDQTIDKELIFEITAKVKRNERLTAINALTKITDELNELDILQSDDGSFDLLDIEVSDELHFSEVTTDGFIYFRLDFKALLTIYKEER